MKKKSKKQTTEVGQSVVNSLKEIRAWQRGELDLSVTEMPDPMPRELFPSPRLRGEGGERRKP